MEQRVQELEKTVGALTAACITQQETINHLTQCVNIMYGMLERDTKFKADLFTYCKELRKEITKLKNGRA